MKTIKNLTQLFFICFIAASSFTSCTKSEILTSIPPLELSIGTSVSKSWQIDLVYDSTGNDITGNYLSSNTSSKNLNIEKDGTANMVTYNDSTTTTENGTWGISKDLTEIYVDFGSTKYSSMNLKLDDMELWLKDNSNNEYHYKLKN